jgi:hypothetical protein
MASRVSITDNCDWCAEINTDTTATSKLAAPGGQVDVCAFCALVYDIVNGRVDQVRKMIDALPAFLASARPLDSTRPPKIAQQARATDAVPGPRAVAEQLSVVNTDLPHAAAAGKESPSLADTLIVCSNCPEHPQLKYRLRKNHADRVHGCKSWEISWLLVSGQPLPYVCKEHTKCRKSLYGFLTRTALAKHHSSPSEDLVDSQHEEAREVPATEERFGNPHAINLTGVWLADVDQVSCPLPHDRPDACTPYYLAYKHRGEHARRSHGLRLDEIMWTTKKGDPFTLDHPCPTCGVGFPNELSLDRHLRGTKSNDRHRLLAAS